MSSSSSRHGKRDGGKGSAASAAEKGGGSSAKEEKERKRAEVLERRRWLQERISEARNVEDFFSLLLPFFSRFTPTSKGAVDEKHGDFLLKYFSADNVGRSLLAWMFDLLKTNMQEHYEKTWGWYDSKKKAELKDSDARFVIAFTDAEEPQPAAYIHLRFIDLDDAPVLYIYEIQVSAAYRNAGLGRFMMQVCEMIGRKSGMFKIALTVFRVNEGAQRFYREKLGYVLDGSSVNPFGESGEHHDILSKALPRRPEDENR